MKIKNFIAIAIATAAVIFILLQFKKTKEQKPFSLTGEWTIDSTYSQGERTDLLPLLIAMTGTEKPTFIFNADSTLTEKGEYSDSTSRKYYLRDSVLYVDEGQGFLHYKVLQMTDSIFSFVTKDSSVMMLKKK